MTMRVVGGKVPRPPVDMGSKIVAAVLIVGALALAAPFVLLGVLILFVLVVSMVPTHEPATQHGTVRAQHARPEPPSIAEVAARSGVTLVTDGSVLPVYSKLGLTVEGRAPTPAARDRWVRLLREELPIYPPELLRAAGLSRIVLADDLHEGNVRPGGLADSETQSVFLLAHSAATDVEYDRGSFHHELYHLADYARDKRFDSDPQWEQLNAVGFRYGSGGAAAITNRSLMPLGSGQGFVSGYAMTSVEEDKAETFEHMIVEPSALDARAAGDSVLRNKLLTIRYRLQQLCPSAGDAFWQAARAAHPPQ